LLDARVHYTVLKQQPPQPTPRGRKAALGGKAGTTPPPHPTRQRRGRPGAGTAVPGPNSVPRTPPPPPSTPRSNPPQGRAYWQGTGTGARATNPFMFHPRAPTGRHALPQRALTWHPATGPCRPAPTVRGAP
jgi:hypothetical protein